MNFEHEYIFYFLTFLLTLLIFTQNDGYSKKYKNNFNSISLTNIQILTLGIISFFLFFCLLKSQNNFIL